MVLGPGWGSGGLGSLRIFEASMVGKSVGLAPVEGLVAQIRNDLKEHQVAEPAEHSVANGGVPRTGAQGCSLHDIADKHRGDQIFAALKSTNRDLCNLLWGLRLVGLLKHLRQLRFDFLLIVEASTENSHGENGVNFDIRSRGAVTVPLGVSSVVHFNLLTEGVRQGADGSLRRRVRTVASNGSEGKSGTSEDEMATRVLHLAARGNRSQPVPKSSMSRVGSSPVDRIHLLPLDWNGYIGEEPRVAEASAAPNNIRTRAIVPTSDLGDDPITLSGVGKVGTDVEEALLHTVQSHTLEKA